MKKEKNVFIDDEPEYFVEQVELTAEMEKEFSDFISNYRSTKELNKRINVIKTGVSKNEKVDS